MGHEVSDLYPWTRPEDKVAENFSLGEETTFPPEG